MSTWRERFAIIIQEIHNTLPEDATLDDRVKALRENKPHMVIGGTSWGEKAWQAARRDYLNRYGYVKRGLPKMGKTPLELAIAELEAKHK